MNRASETCGTPASILSYGNPRRREKREETGRTFEEIMPENC